MQALKDGLKAAVFTIMLTLPAWHAAEAGTRADHWSGVDFAVGEPYVSYLGFNLGFNVGDDARLEAGLGTLGHWTTYAGDAKFFATDSQWSPYFGVGLSYMTGTHGSYLLWNLDFDHAFMPFFEGGIDFQSEIGVHVGFNLALSAPYGHLLVMPGIAIGWYF